MTPRPPRTCEAPRCRRTLPPGRRRFCSDLCRVRGHRAERRLDPGQFGEGVIRMIAALARRAGSADIDEFVMLWGVREAADRAAAEAVDQLRAQGYSWHDLAEPVRLSKQGLAQWRGRPSRQPAVNDQLTPGGTPAIPAHDRAPEPPDALVSDGTDR